MECDKALNEEFSFVNCATFFGLLCESNNNNNFKDVGKIL